MRISPVSGAETGPATPPAASRGSEYAALSQQVRQAGLLDRRLRYYIWKITFTALALAAGWTAFALAGDSWWQLGTAVFLAVVFTQLGFLGHDAGHRQVFRSARANYLLGAACGNLGVGLSYGWWVSKHNRHHQIEHHLFPSMPRPSLRRSQPLIAAYCAERGLPCTEATLLGSYAQALRHLNTIGRLTHRAPVTPPSLASTGPAG